MFTEKITYKTDIWDVYKMSKFAFFAIVSCLLFVMAGFFSVFAILSNYLYLVLCIICMIAGLTCICLAMKYDKVQWC